MFSRHNEQPAFLELSSDVRDEQDWVIGQLRVFDFPLNITTFAFDPVSALLAIGTATGVIHIYGGPGVQCKITVPYSTAVRFLNFATSTQKIICIDENSQLHVWDLATFGGPEYLTSARFDRVNTVTLSPCFTHVFLGLQTGEVKTYDLTCLRKSPYTIPNMWKLYESKVTASGMPATKTTSQPCVEQVMHPRDLNLIFVAYSGGIILSNLTDRTTVRAYELILPPGAPGGTGYGTDDVLTHRRPAVTTMSIHPSGHLFAVGHVDGSIAFWAVDDDTEPILVRTVDEEDVNVVDSLRLQAQLEQGHTQGNPQSLREPIFRLSWSGYSNSTDPRSGETTLTVLGGLQASKNNGFTVLLLPSFQPSEPPAESPPPAEGLHPFFKMAMRISLNVIKSYFYETEGESHDYVLLPRHDLHFSGNHDPYAILCLTSSNDKNRVVHAFGFPPAGWITNLQDKNDPDTLNPPHSPGGPPQQSASANEKPAKLLLPFQLSSGSLGLVGGKLLAVGNELYQAFVDTKAAQRRDQLNLEGGVAFDDQTKQNELRLAKYQPRRILVAYYQDRSIRFFDISAQLLINADNEPLKSHFPNPLPDLTVELERLLGSSAVKEAELFGRTTPIRCVHVAPEALEFAVVLETGNIVVYRPSSSNPPNSTLTSSESDSQITLLDTHVRSGRFSPYFLLKPKASVNACAISNIGFLAASYSDGSLLIIDMRGPRVMSRPVVHTKHRRGPSTSAHSGTNPDIVSSLTWTITRLDKDSTLKVRLVASRVSGITEVYTLVHSDNPASWSISGEPIICKGVTDPVADGSFILDSKTGARIGAGRSLLRASFRSESAMPSLLVTVGAKGARCCVNINGERIGKVEWGIRAGSAIGAQVVERMAAKALVILTDKQEALAYSLPYLEHIKSIPLLPGPSLPLSVDGSGDFVAFIPHNQSGAISSMTYGTFFDIRRAYSSAEIDFGIKPSPIPPPQPVSLGPASLLGAWFNFNQTLTGDQVDALLGGPDRPVPEKPRSTGESSEGGIASTATTAAASLAASAAAAQTNIYNRLTSALNERGQLLGDLGERFNSLEEDSKNMVAQAKKLAAQQTAKSWLGF